MRRVLKLRIYVQAVLEKQVDSFFVVFFDFFQKQFMGAPLFKMLSLFGLLNDLLTYLALCCISKTSNGMRACLVSRNDFLAVGALNITTLIHLLELVLIGYKLLLAAKDLGIFLGFDVEDLH